MVGYVAEDPGRLTQRAQDFLHRCSRREDFDRGLVGADLDQEIRAVYVQSNGRIVSMLEFVQERYGGLTYTSGFFDSDVFFTPVCEPEDPTEELEILYAVQTGSPAGACLSADGVVIVGVDYHEVPEFASLDSLIECDSMFELAEQQPATGTMHLAGLDRLRGAVELIEASPFRLRRVPEAGGAHTYWFSGQSAYVFLSGAWSAIGFMPPSIRVWAGNQQEVNRILATFA
ncbi:hypothetical protein [Micromonospora inaquosa]|nr:hypothetical protein [Micromonospora inaquosa]